MAKLLAFGLTFIIMIASFLLICILLGYVLHLVLSPAMLLIAALGFLSNLALISLGLLCAGLTRTSRGTLFLFLSIVLVLILLRLGASLLVSIVSDASFLGLVGLRDSITMLSGLFRWFSPIAYLLDGADAILRFDFPETAFYMLLSLLCALFGLELSRRVFKRKGVMQ